MHFLQEAYKYICLKSKGTGVTSNIFQFEATTRFPTCLMHLVFGFFRPSLPRFYAILEGFFLDLTTLLMVATLSKRPH